MCVRCISLTINVSLCLRSTRTKATSSTAKPRGSTSASPWWTSSRSASGYRRSCLRRRWRRRAKTRVSLASLCPRILPLLIRFACPNLHPVPVPEAQHLAYSRPRYATLSPALCSIWFCIWTPQCPHAEPETAFFPADWRSNSTSILPRILWSHLQSSDPKSPPLPPESRHRLTTRRDVFFGIYRKI